MEVERRVIPAFVKLAVVVRLVSKELCICFVYPFDVLMCILP